MKNQNEKKLTLTRTTIRNLTTEDLDAVAGGTNTVSAPDELNAQPRSP